MKNKKEEKSEKIIKEDDPGKVIAGQYVPDAPVAQGKVIAGHYLPDVTTNPNIILS